MALDFYRLDNNEYLFKLEGKELADLAEIFNMFTQWTGLFIDPYGDIKLPLENQEILIRVIDEYITSTDLNKDKAKTSSILGFKGLLLYFTKNKVDLQLKED
ncbi:hypothetical protein [Runella aurantiaca]|uniref:Uncharacterized protein n=1 Tax=Runella aurantiaca TaxID=2282308 RepID=A0A369ICA1_9BACT|nr:hypothetical protein [Runella aurantiaca]RDB07401.1 hypothetical protein DVG78_05205 [Runella aurantiaca]